MLPPVRTIAIVAHADAGKTTITEQFLFLSGLTRQLGNVDQGTTQTDFLPVEKERGISVRSAHTTFSWNQVQINLIDTPGHVDFSADVERVLRVVDGVILVISAVEGIQAHTETLWRALQKRLLPVILFVNKIDRTGADIEAVIKSITKEFRIRPLSLQKCMNEVENSFTVSSLWSSEYMQEQLFEHIVASNEQMLNAYLEGKKIAFSEADNQLCRLVQSCLEYPLFMGAAKYGTGVEDLLNAVVKYFPSPAGDPLLPLSALVYGVGHDKNLGKIAFVRLFNGKISNRDVVFNATHQVNEKVTQVRRIFPGKYEDIGVVEAGDIAGICGLGNVRVGDLLGLDNAGVPDRVNLGTPLFVSQVRAVNPKDYPALAAALLELSAEDPSLEFEWLREEAELLVKIMGWIQMEILERILADRFSIRAKFENPSVIYKETPSSAGEGFVRYWMPKPCWAVLKFLIEPGERGSGVIYQSRVSVNDIQQKYQNEVERTITEALKQGIRGWEVTDIKITLIEGEDHTIHSRPGDFIIATPMGIMNGLVNTETTLLEPLIRFRINAPEEMLGVITSDITVIRGSFESPVIEHGRFELSGILPLSTSLDFPVKLSSRSGGKARIATQFIGYQKCSDEQGVIRPFKGISPLDTSKYILKARKAIQ